MSHLRTEGACISAWSNIKCQDETLKALLTNMANCDEQCMQLVSEADFGSKVLSSPRPAKEERGCPKI